MATITIQKNELKELIREAVSEAIYLDVREVSNDELSDETLDDCEQAEQEFSNGTASSFDEAYKKCMK